MSQNNKNHVKEIPLEKSHFKIEDQQLFSQSLIWNLQSKYFSEMGFEAWRRGEVPHYVTSNPKIANSYAEIIFTFYNDHKSRNNQNTQAEPFYIIEAGSGSGRFAFHLISRLQWLCEQAGISLSSFKYVLTDFTQSNLDFWRAHPRFQTFFDIGLLDMALFDLTNLSQLTLQISNKTINSYTIHNPLIFIANYVFDSIPHDLIYFNEKQMHPCLISLFSDKDPAEISAGELLENLHLIYEYGDISDFNYSETYLQELVTFYRENLTDTHVLIPSDGLKCLHWLQKTSRHGMLVLSADKGDHRLSALQNKALPHLERHGSFSLSVNYHAFKMCCELNGGIALFPENNHSSINVSCMFWIKNAEKYKDTHYAYRRAVIDFGPDDFYSVLKHAGKHTAKMTGKEILAYLRLSCYDSHQLARFMDRFIELAPELNHHELEDIVIAINNSWAKYFPLGESMDLANKIAIFLYEVDLYELALFYFSQSILIYGNDTGTLYNMAVCNYLTGKNSEAEKLLSAVLRHDPKNEPALDLIKKLTRELSTDT